MERSERNRDPGRGAPSTQRRFQSSWGLRPLNGKLTTNTLTFYILVKPYAIDKKVEFGCPRPLTKQLVRRLSATYQLSADQTEMLLAVVDGK